MLLCDSNTVLVCCVSHLRSGLVSDGPNDAGQQSDKQLNTNGVETQFGILEK